MEQKSETERVYYCCDGCGAEVKKEDLMAAFGVPANVAGCQHVFLVALLDLAIAGSGKLGIPIDALVLLLMERAGIRVEVFSVGARAEPRKEDLS